MTTNGINGGGFEAATPAGTNNINAHYSDNPGSAFAATDMSTQGNAGFNQEGSSGSLPITGADESDM